MARGRRLDGDRELCDPTMPTPGGDATRVVPSRRWVRAVTGVLVAVVAAVVFTALCWGLRDWLVDQGRWGLPILLAVRIACFAAIGWGCWRAYQGFRRP
ncbi:hypothetical protein [Micromonospora sp. NPDC005203]|uniref:hypothetical protein n=1 Tax=Micromonospora sp. NPDC005203 TaxID=3364226 RepID=UPI0036A619F7